MANDEIAHLCHQRPTSTVASWRVDLQRPNFRFGCSWFNGFRRDHKGRFVRRGRFRPVKPSASGFVDEPGEGQHLLRSHLRFGRFRLPFPLHPRFGRS